MTYKTIFFLLLLNICWQTTIAQKFLSLDKGGKIKRIKFYEGDYIHIKTVDHLSHHGVISQLLDSSFILNNQEVFINEVSSVVFKNKSYGLNLISGVSFLAGIGYFAIDTSNRLINDDKPKIHSNTSRSSLAFLSVAIVSKVLSNKTYKVNKKHRLKIIDISI